MSDPTHYIITADQWQRFTASGEEDGIPVKSFYIDGKSMHWEQEDIFGWIPYDATDIVS